MKAYQSPRMRNHECVAAVKQINAFSVELPAREQRVERCRFPVPGRCFSAAVEANAVDCVDEAESVVAEDVG